MRLGKIDLAEIGKTKKIKPATVTQSHASWFPTSDVLNVEKQSSSHSLLITLCSQPSQTPVHLMAAAQVSQSH